MQAELQAEQRRSMSAGVLARVSGMQEKATKRQQESSKKSPRGQNKGSKSEASGHQQDSKGDITRVVGMLQAEPCRRGRGGFMPMLRTRPRHPSKRSAGQHR
eukprot:240341-Chlamydomonas_euryale.AAC.20